VINGKYWINIKADYVWLNDKGLNSTWALFRLINIDLYT
jgi:hypothetical protein